MQSFSTQNQHLVMCIDNVSKLSVLQRYDGACYCSVKLPVVIAMLEWFWNSYYLFSTHSSKTSSSTLQYLRPHQNGSRLK